MHSLMDQPIPTLSLFVLEWGIPKSAPLPIERRGTILAAEIGLKCFLKAAAEDHGGSGLFLAPAIQITMAVTAGTAKVVGDLRVAIVHLGYSPSRPSCSLCKKVPPTRMRRQRHRGSGRSAR